MMNRNQHGDASRCGDEDSARKHVQTSRRGAPGVQELDAPCSHHALEVVWPSVVAHRGQ